MIRMLEPCLGTAHTDVKDDNAATSVWAMVLNTEDVENGINGTHLKMEQMETTMMADLKPQVENVVPRKSKMENNVALQIACIPQMMVPKIILALLAKSLKYIPQCAYKNAYTRVGFVIYNVFD